MFSPFPLFRLPRLVLTEVFKLLSIGDKIKLSFCSKRISTQINNDRLYSRKVILDLHDCDGKIVVHYGNNKDSFEIFISPETEKTLRSYARQYSIAGCTVRVAKTRKGIRTLWKNYQDQKEGFRTVIRHLSNMFQCKIPTPNRWCDSDFYTISILFDLQVEFKRPYIRFTGSKDENLLFNQLSSGFRLVEGLRISSTPDTGFKPVFTSWPQEITIFSSAWFTLEYLLKCTCTSITLEESHLENKDLDEVLKNWKAGRLPNLKHLSIDSLNITNNGEHILGINLRELDGMVIQTDDGSKKATIKRRPHDIAMFVTPLE